MSRRNGLHHQILGTVEVCIIKVALSQIQPRRLEQLEQQGHQRLHLQDQFLGADHQVLAANQAQFLGDCSHVVPSSKYSVRMLSIFLAVLNDKCTLPRTNE